jgi:hypothetical protein
VPVSTLHNWENDRGFPGLPKRGKKRAEQTGPAAARPITPPREAGLTPHDLRLLTEMARRAGGFQQLREFLDVLRGMG